MLALAGFDVAPIGRWRTGRRPECDLHRTVAKPDQASVREHEWRKHLVTGQKPFAALVGCSDSRVPVELVFDQGFGDLFVLRVAGNVIAEDVFGSIHYAGRHLGTQLFVVLGHEGCGAVSAALAGDEGEASHLRSLLRLIEPGLAGLDPASTGESRLRAAVAADVRWSVRQLATSPEGKRAVEEYGA
jgi:carbonic anhydrase